MLALLLMPGHGAHGTLRTQGRWWLLRGATGVQSCYSPTCPGRMVCFPNLVTMGLPPPVPPAQGWLGCLCSGCPSKSLSSQVSVFPGKSLLGKGCAFSLRFVAKCMTLCDARCVSCLVCTHVQTACTRVCREHSWVCRGRCVHGGDPEWFQILQVGVLSH